MAEELCQDAHANSGPFRFLNLPHMKAASESVAGAHARKVGAQALALYSYFQYVPRQDL